MELAYLHPLLLDGTFGGSPSHQGLLDGLVSGGEVEEGDREGEELAIMVSGNV